MRGEKERSRGEERKCGGERERERKKGRRETPLATQKCSSRERGAVEREEREGKERGIISEKERKKREKEGDFPPASPHDGIFVARERARGREINGVRGRERRDGENAGEREDCRRHRKREREEARGFMG